MPPVPPAQQYELATPPAAAMIESMRGIGYSLETALADLIDNSIAAGARTVWLTLYWNGTGSTMSLLDDGQGMNSAELLQAMRPGSRSPLEQRSVSDLGRFGLGLKTASFSQCRCLTVASRRQAQPIHVRRWDLDHVKSVDQWQLLTQARADAQNLLEPLSKLASGTLVLWQELDRLVGSSSIHDKDAQERFLASIDRVREHLAMVFHRYLEDTRQGLQIFVNGSTEVHKLKPWDPFLRNETATQQLPEEPILSSNGEISFQGFVLPHPDRLKRQDLLEHGGGPDGWTSQQGFYVYRNRRLLVWGTWLSLGIPRRWKRDELHKLARIRLDIPNAGDHDWKIDIKKSTATPPAELRARLTDLAVDVRERAIKVFRTRGIRSEPRPSGPTSETARVWKALPRESGTAYRVDRQHPLIKGILEQASKIQLELEPLLQLIELSVPVETIWIDQMQQGEKAQLRASKPPEELLELARFQLTQFMSRDQNTLDVARRRLAGMEPFSAWSDAMYQLNPLT